MQSLGWFMQMCGLQLAVVITPQQVKPVGQDEEHSRACSCHSYVLHYIAVRTYPRDRRSFRASIHAQYTQASVAPHLDTHASSFLTAACLQQREVCRGKTRPFKVLLRLTLPSHIIHHTASHHITLHRIAIVWQESVAG